MEYCATPVYWALQTTRRKKLMERNGQQMSELNVNGYPVRITNPDKLMWPELGIRKADYISILAELAPYILPHARNRLLTAIRYPDGVEGKYFFQKNTPEYAPDWLETREWNDNNYTVMNNLAALIWLGNQ